MSVSAAAAAMTKATASNASQYGKEGKYVFEVQAIKSHDGHKGLSVIADLLVVSATKTGPNEPNPIGAVISYVENFSDASKGGPGRFKGFLCALTGWSDSEMTGERLMSFLDATKSPGTFLLVNSDVIKKHLEAKNGKPARDIESHRWENHDLTDAEMKAIDTKRAAAKLPPLSEVLK